MIIICGIFGYYGNKEARDIIIQGLKDLEYRGYDSFGCCLKDNKSLIIKKSFFIKDLSESLKAYNNPFNLAISHSRWATHGAVTLVNAHPHTNFNKNIAVVHNGIIENYKELKQTYFPDKDFISQTDTEIIPQLIAYFIEKYNDTIESAIIMTVNLLKGSFAFLVLNNNTNELIGVRKGSPLKIGISDREFFISSDSISLSRYTNNIIDLNDYEIFYIKETQEGLTLKIYNYFTKEDTTRSPEKYNFNENLGIEYKESYMLKEIEEQPLILKNLIKNKNRFDIPVSLDSIDKFIIIACGTAYHAGLVAKYWYETLLHKSVEVEVASEFRYKENIVTDKTVIIAISQSGETADTLEALRKIKKGFKIGIINVENSTLSKEVDLCLYTKAGKEVSVASTKAFTAQLLVLYQLMELLAQKSFFNEILNTIPMYMEEILEKQFLIKELAQKYCTFPNFVYIGRHINYPIAMEGSLKLKEISYIHSEAISAGELKHGTLALIDKNFPTLALATESHIYEKIVSNIQEIKARKGNILVVVNNTSDLPKVCENFFLIPKINEPLLYPFLNVIFLQLFAYFVAKEKGLPIDKPRNLAKSVTVE